MNLRWTNKMLDWVPSWCLRCENQVKGIRLSTLYRYSAVLVRCGHCGYIFYQMPFSIYETLQHAEASHVK